MPEDLNQIVDSEDAWQVLARGKTSGKSVRAARELFERVAQHYECPPAKRASTAPQALWAERVGSPEKLLAIHGPVSDLVVVSRPGKKGSKVARHFMLSAVLYTSRPVLIVPARQSAPVGEHVAIRWNDSNEAASSVAAAMPIIQRAKTVTVLRGGLGESVGPGVAQLRGYLAHYGIKTRQLRLDRKKDESKGLIEAYRSSQADVLIMGAYSRARFRQRLFGGVTEHMLHKANIPILLKHH
ncbi:MAG: universal stress protein [Pseudomonadota bacterium]